MRYLKKIIRKLDPRWKEVPETYHGHMRRQLRSISFATGGMLSIGNIDAIAYALKNTHSDAAIMEIGAFCGLSSNMITFLKADFGLTNQFFSCDPWNLTSGQDSEYFSENLNIKWSELEDFLQSAYKERVGFFSKSNLPFAIREYSNNLFDKWDANESVTDVFGRKAKLGGPLAFVFIDGDHSYDSAKSDFDNVDKYLVKDGFILFDDSGDGGNWEPNKVAKEALKSGDYKLISKNPNYLVQKI